MKRKLAGCCLKYLTDAVGTNAVGTVLLQLSYLQRRTTMQKSACWACGLLPWTVALQVPFDKQKCAGAQKIYAILGPKKWQNIGHCFALEENILRRRVWTPGFVDDGRYATTYSNTRKLGQNILLEVLPFTQEFEGRTFVQLEADRSTPCSRANRKQ